MSMPPPAAADDVSPLALRNDVDRFAINDVMFALHVPQAHIIAEGNIMCEARIICPAGQTSLKKARRSVLFSGSPCWARTNDPSVNRRSG